MTIKELKAIRERITEHRDDSQAAIYGSDHLEAEVLRTQAATLNWVLDIVLPRYQPRFEVAEGLTRGMYRIRDNRSGTSLDIKAITAEFADREQAERMVAWLNDDHENRAEA